jgi:hypothetical protein
MTSGTRSLCRMLYRDGNNGLMYDAENRISTAFMNDCSTVVASPLHRPALNKEKPC